MPIDNAPTSGKTPAKKAAPSLAAEFQAPDKADGQGDAQGVKTNPDETVKSAPDVAHDDDFTFVRMPDGSLRAVRNDSIQRIGVFDSTAGVPEVPDAEVYAWLADGSVERVKESSLPGAAGTNAPYGYFERDNKMHHIVAVHPVETEKG